MTWYVKYRVQFTDDLGVDWKVHIKEQAESSFTITDYTATGQPLTIEGYGDDDPFMQSVQGSKATIRIWNPEDFELLELFSAEMLQFQVIIYQDDTLFWKGYVLPETYQEAYNQAPLEANITATDGLGLLKEFQFSELDYGFTRRTYSKAIYDMLLLVGINGFTEYINIYHSGMDDGVGDSPLDQTGFDPQLFKTDHCYKALEDILGMFNAGIKQEQGQIVIYRYEEVKATMYGRKFTSATAKTAVTNTPDQFINRRDQFSYFKDVEGGTLTMLPLVSRHIINYDFGLKDSILRYWEFFNDDFEFSDLGGVWTILPWTFENTTPVPLYKMIPGEDKGIHLTVNDVEEAAHMEQVVEGLKARSEKFRLTFEYMFLNPGEETKEGRFFNCSLRNEGATTWYYDGNTQGWTTSSVGVGIRVFTGDIPPGNSDWKKADIVVGDDAGIKVDGSLRLRLFPFTVKTTWLVEKQVDVKIAYRNVQIIMTPAEGESGTGIGYTYNTGVSGRVIEHERVLGDGFTTSRHAENQLLSYAGIIDIDGDDPHVAEWSTRGNSEEKTIYEVINDEMGKQYVRPRQLIDLPVWSSGGFISGIGNMQDTLNKVGGNNRKFHVNIRSFDAKRRDYELILTELI